MPKEDDTKRLTGDTVVSGNAEDTIVSDEAEDTVVGATQPVDTLVGDDGKTLDGNDETAAAMRHAGAYQKPAPGNLEARQRQVDPILGTIIDGRFEVLSEIARGAGGTVYKGLHITMHRPVAVKVLHAHLMGAEHQERFKRELHTVGMLKHPNIMEVYAAGALDNMQPYMVMEFLQGQTLADLIKSGLHWPDSRCLAILKEVLSGLSYAHSQGIIHRDLKPSNVVLTRGQDGQPRVLIVDFGIAKLVNLPEGQQQRLTQTGMIYGTPSYMSPEQCRGAEIDVRTDVYSFGCMMYETLTGKPPFAGATILETMSMHMSEEAQSMNERFPHLTIPPVLDLIVMKMLRKDPTRRLQSVEEISQAIAEFENAPKSLPTAIATGTARKPVNRKLGWLRVITAAVVTVAISVFAVQKFAFVDGQLFFIENMILQAQKQIEAGQLQEAFKTLQQAEQETKNWSQLARLDRKSLLAGLRQLADSEPDIGTRYVIEDQILKVAIAQYGDNGAELIPIYANLGKLCLDKGEQLRPRDTTSASICYLASSENYKHALDISKDTRISLDQSTLKEYLQALKMTAAGPSDSKSYLASAIPLLHECERLKVPDRDLEFLYNNCGLAYAQDGQHKQAEACFEKACKIYVSYGHDLTQLSAYQWLWAKEAYTIGNYSVASDLLIGMVHHLEQSGVTPALYMPQVLATTGASLAAQGRKLESIPYLERCLATLGPMPDPKSDPGKAFIWNELNKQAREALAQTKPI